MKWPFEYFTIEEILDPFFDDCPVDYDDSLSPEQNWDLFRTQYPEVANNLFSTLEILDYIRDYIRVPLRVNSTFRISDRPGKAHRLGHAIDVQPAGMIVNPFWCKKVMDYVSTQDLFTGFRVFWEWKIGKYGWLHIDRNYKINPNEIKRFVGYPQDGKMVYQPYENKAPWEYA